MSILAGAKATAVDLTLPDVVTAFGNGTNTVTATTFTDLPTTSCVAAITNPHPTADMLTYVTYSGWATASTNALRFCPRVSGSTTVTAGIGGGLAVGWGEVPRVIVEYQQYMASATIELPPGTATFTMQAHRESASGTQQLNYPTIRLVPVRYLF